MKLFVCFFLVLVILEEYHCDPYWLWPCEGYIPSYHPYHWYPPYGPNGLEDRLRYNPDYPLDGYQSYYQNGLGHGPSYQPYYSPSWYPSYRTLYPTWSSRPFGATYNIPYDKNGGASNGILQRTPYHRGSYGPQYDRRFGTLYPTPNGVPNGSPSGAPNGSPSGAPNGSPSGAPNGSPSGAPNSSPNGITNGTPAQTPVKTGDSKRYFVTPTGIQDTPAQPLGNAS